MILKEYFESKGNNKYIHKEKKLIDFSLLNESGKISEFGKSVYTEKSPTKFLYKSYEGLHVVPSSEGNSIKAVGELHYLPLYRGREIQDLSEVSKEDKERFMRSSVLKLILAFNNLLEFIEKHPETTLGKIDTFVGETFKEMANFLKKELGINFTEIRDPEFDEISFSFSITLQELREGLEKFKRNRPEIFNKVINSAFYNKDNRDFTKTFSSK